MQHWSCPRTDGTHQQQCHDCFPSAVLNHNSFAPSHSDGWSTALSDWARTLHALPVSCQVQFFTCSWLKPSVNLISGAFIHLILMRSLAPGSQLSRHRLTPPCCRGRMPAGDPKTEQQAFIGMRIHHLHAVPPLGARLVQQPYDVVLQPLLLLAVMDRVLLKL